MKRFLTSMVLCMLMLSGIVYAQSPLGNGSDGTLTVNSGMTVTTDDVRSALIGTSFVTTKILKVADAGSFVQGDEVIIITMSDPETNMLQNKVGRYEFNRVQSVLSGEIRLINPLENTYDATGNVKHQVVKIPNYKDVTVNGAITCSAWDGSSGGILLFRSTGTVTISSTGVIHANGKGYRGGSQYGSSHGGGQGGESYIGNGGRGGDYGGINNSGIGAGGGGAAYNTYYGADGIAGGGGAGTATYAGKGSPNNGGAGGGGGGHAGSAGGAGYGTFGLGGHGYSKNGNGQNGGENKSGDGGFYYIGGGGGGGGTYGYANLSRIMPGSGGGCSGRHDAYNPGFGGAGGGILILSAKIINNNGTISSNGNNGSNPENYGGGGGAGSGGSLYVIAENITSSKTIEAKGGTGGTGFYSNDKGGNGGNGRIRLDKNTLSNTGTITPAAFEGYYPNVAVTLLLNTSNQTGTYTVKAYIYDKDQNPITAAKLYYRVNNGSFTEVTMTGKKGVPFSGNIPGQTAKSVIDYYVFATDGTDNYYAPANAPTGYYTFSIRSSAPASLTVTANTAASLFLKWKKPADLMNFVKYSVYRSQTKDFIPLPTNRIVASATDTFYNDLNLHDFYTYYYLVCAHYSIGGTADSSFSSYASGVANNSNSTTVLGYVFLEGQSNHANIKVKFNPQGPSAVLDSAYTNALGFFEKVINPGIYAITYEKLNYQTYTSVSNYSIITDLNLGQKTLDYLGTELKGNVTGILDGIYSVTGDITVPNGDSLIIQAGSEIRFIGNYNLFVYGYLEVNGVPGDSVLFTSKPANQVFAAGQWQGIDFYDASDDNSFINCAIIQYAVDGVYWTSANAKLRNSRIHHCSDNGLEVVEDVSDPEITNVETSYNSVYGIYVLRGDPVINNLNSHHNSSYGAYYNESAYGTIKNSKFNYNSSHGIRFINWASPALDSCVINNNSSWGVRIDYSEPSFKNTYFSNNDGDGVRINQDNNNWVSPYFEKCTFEANKGYGITFYRYATKSATLLNCTIINNLYSGVYIFYYNNPVIKGNRIINNNNYGIYINDADWNYPDIQYNIIANNKSDGIYKNRRGAPTIKYNTIYGNLGDGIEINDNNEYETVTNNIIANNGNFGIRANAAIEKCQYNNFFENQSGQLSNLSYMPVDTWKFTSFNANSDTADIYLNFSEEPSFVFSNSEDFRLKLNSSCLNAGDPTVKDPDGTTSDVGALFRPAGNPYIVTVTGYSDKTVSLSWTAVTLDSLQSYNVYYKLSTAPTYTLFGNKTKTVLNADVNNLTNNVLYDFTVTGVYPNSESIYAPKVSEKPGLPNIVFNPVAINDTVKTDTLQKKLVITNTGSKELTIDFPLGQDNGFVHMDGSDDLIRIGDHAHLESMSALTLECWIRNSIGSWTEPFGKSYPSYQMTMNIDGGSFGMYKGYDGTNYQHWYGYYPFQKNQWYHLAITWTGNTITFYVNGVQVNQYLNAVSDPIPNTGTNFEIGRRADYGGYYINGDIAEVRVWNVARTKDQIKRFKDSPLRGNETGLVGYWPLNKNYSDYSPYAKTGTPYNQTYVSTSTTPLLSKVPFVLTKTSATIQPGAKDSVTFKFYKTAQQGTYPYTTTVLTNIPTKEKINYEINLTYGTTVPPTPVHFIPVAKTDTAYTIIVTSAKIDGTSIQVGDEVGVFDGSLCVGAAIFEGSFNMNIKVWKKNVSQGKQGYTTGNAITFKIYDTSADMEATTQSQFTIGNGKFGYGQFSSVILNGTIYKIQNVKITGGAFNLISYNLLPRYASSDIVFGNLNSMKIVYNDEGKALIPDYGINSIGDIDFRDGYHIFCASNDTVKLEGTSVNPMEWNMTVQAGKWNSIGFLGENPLNITTAFPANVIDSIDIVQNASGQTWIPSLSVNTIGNMMPGTGYQIFLSSGKNITFTYQTTNGHKKENIPEKSNPQHFQFKETGLPYILVIDDPTFENQPLTTGDEIAAYDGQTCVGAVVYDGSGRISLSAWEKSESYNLPGFTSGHSIIIKIFRMADNNEYECKIKSLNDNPTNLLYKGGVYSFLTVNGSASLVDINDRPEEHYFIHCFPNPFSHILNFEYRVNETSRVKLEIYSMTGEKVSVITDKLQPAGTYSLSWDRTGTSGVKIPAGVYQYLFVTDTFSETHTIVVVK